jgi:Zn-dependent protease
LPSLEILLAQFGILVFSLSFHEMAHAWTADRLGDSTARQLGRLTLNPIAHVDLVGTVIFPIVAMLSGIPLIGWAKPVPVDMRQLQEPRRDFAIVAAAGPASNLLLATIGALLYHLAAGPVAAGVMTEALRFFVLINVLLAVFNMIPVPPLDGGNVLSGLLRGPVAHVYDRLRPYGFLILYGLMFTGLLYTLIAPPANFLLSWLL